MSTKTPWAVLLCKFKDDVIEPTSFRDAARRFPFLDFNNSARAILAHRFGMPPPISLKSLIKNITDPGIVLQNVVALFTAPDIENVVTYWQDISYGELDLSGSAVFGWLTLEQNKAEYSSRDEPLVEWAKQAAKDQDIDLSSYYGVIVFMSDATDLWGSSKTVVCDIASNFSQILQEVGHGYDLKHSRSVVKKADYENPFCIMSGLTFGDTDPTFKDRFGWSGPGLCSPYVFQAGWLSESRISRVPANGATPVITELVLSPLGERNPTHPQVAVFDLQIFQKVTYFIEYRSGGWDRGLKNPTVVIHQVWFDDYAYYAGSIATSLTPTEVGQPYVDSLFDLSVKVLSVFSDGTVKIRIAPKGLSLCNVVKTKLGITEGFSVRTQVLQGRTNSLRDRLLELLAQ